MRRAFTLVVAVLSTAPAATGTEPDVILDTYVRAATAHRDSQIEHLQESVKELAGNRANRRRVVEMKAEIKRLQKSSSLPIPPLPMAPANGDIGSMPHYARAIEIRSDSEALVLYREIKERLISSNGRPVLRPYNVDHVFVIRGLSLDGVAEGVRIDLPRVLYASGTEDVEYMVGGEPVEKRVMVLESVDEILADYLR